MAKPDTLGFRADTIPAPLKAIPRWILWKWESRNGKWVKTPRQKSGAFASVADSSTWTTFGDSYGALLTGSIEFDGLGLVLPPGHVGVDLDDCYGPDGFTPDAELLLAMLPTYSEISPSGTGVKLIATGQLSDKLAKTCKAKGIELYDGGSTNRFFTMTGFRVGDHAEITGQRESLNAIQHMITEPPTAVTLSPDGESAFRAALLLSKLKNHRADHYDDWLRVGMALAWADKSDEMLDRWIDWSKQSDKFTGEASCREKWESFRRAEGRLVTISTLEKLAKEDGYREGVYQTGAITGAALLSKHIEREYLINDFMVRGEPMIVGGPSKCLKTSIALEMALSIVSGRPFFADARRFAVETPRAVMFISGESGEGTLQDNLRMMCAVREIPDHCLDNLHIGFKLPKLDDGICVEDLLAELREKEIDVVFIDPLYRSLRAGDNASNVYAMGAQLELIAEKVHRAGVTPILLHHFRKQGKTYTEAPELDDLSQSGIAEFGRQFLLLKRREAYQYDGVHNLWFSWGGSAGHQGSLLLEAHTGTKKAGLKWQTTLRSHQEFEALKKEAKEIAKAGGEEDTKGELIAFIREHPGLSIRQISEEVGANRAKIKTNLDELERAGVLRQEPGQRGASIWFVH